ncbi:MAG: CPBP family intramembrane glutamic endopeptidase [Anaerovorax sp.]|nr:CPBP family intramembrane glutamic endopeptidase [Anaerovorax sp.]
MKTNFFRFENTNKDLPFYNDKQTVFKPLLGFVIIIIIYGSFFCTDVIKGIIPSYLGPFINILLPLVLFIPIVKSRWTEISGKIHKKDLLTIFKVLVINLIITAITSTILHYFFEASSNPLAGILHSSSLQEKFIIYLKIIPMLLGEELITIIPFLIVLEFSYKHLNFSRKKAIIITWVVTSLFFGAIHLPTYSWNIVQAIIGIGIARIVLTFAYIKTKNIWISFLVHLLNDWILFLPMLF